jgi:hypothetical protein
MMPDTPETAAVYRERAELLAWLAATHPAVITPATDIEEPGWLLLFITAAGHQMSWHIHPRDVTLFEHVEHVEPEDPRAHWDGHSSVEKYQRIRQIITVVTVISNLLQGGDARA